MMAPHKGCQFAVLLVILLPLVSLCSQNDIDFTCRQDGSLASLSTAVLNEACSVNDIRELRNNLLLSTQPRSMCSPACRNLIQSLVSEALTCTDAELEVFLGSNGRNALTSAFKEVGKCAPPKVACIPLFRRLERWESSSQGQACLANARAVQLSENNDETQAQSRAICDSSACGGVMSQFMNLLEDNECQTWDAYKMKREEYDLICFQSHNSSFCNPEFSMQKFLATLRAVTAGEDTEESYDNQLADMCGSCFNEFMRIRHRFAVEDINEVLSTMDKVCVRDFAKDIYCYPRYRSRIAQYTQDGRNTLSRSICNQDEMGSCATIMALRDHPDGNLSTAETTAVDTMCLMRISETDPGASQDALCEVVMADIVGNFAEDKTFVGATYDTPSECDSLVKVNDTCTWGCQNAYTPVRDTFGCCYTTTRNLYKWLDFVNVDNVFLRTDLVGSECNRPPRESCDVLNVGEGVTTSFVVEVPHGFLTSGDDVTIALLKDAARAIGRTSSVAEEAFDSGFAGDRGIEILKLESISEVATRVFLKVSGQDANHAQALVDRFELLKTKDGAFNYYTEALYFK